jgi:hypothetical protein
MKLINSSLALSICLFSSSAHANLGLSAAERTFGDIAFYHCEGAEDDDLYWVLERLDDGRLRDPIRGVTSLKEDRDDIFEFGPGEYAVLSEHKLSWMVGVDVIQMECNEISYFLTYGSASILDQKAEEQGKSVAELLGIPKDEAMKSLDEDIMEKDRQIDRLSDRLQEQTDKVNELERELNSNRTNEIASDVVISGLKRDLEEARQLIARSDDLSDAIREIRDQIEHDFEVEISDSNNPGTIAAHIKYWLRKKAD